jgi:hypothetical protein
VVAPKTVVGVLVVAVAVAVAAATELVATVATAGTTPPWDRLPTAACQGLQLRQPLNNAQA